jgi:hypothetical protein
MEPGTLEHIHSLYVPPLFEDVLFLVFGSDIKGDDSTRSSMSMSMSHISFSARRDLVNVSTYLLKFYQILKI